MSAYTHIILPDTGKQLIRAELALAFTALGLKVSHVLPEEFGNAASPNYLPELLLHGKSLFLSINFHGINNVRPFIKLFAQNKGHIAVWCVDNPWNVLSSVQTPLWKKFPIFVTDASFIPALQQNGAEKVFHLPLAASPTLFTPNAQRAKQFPAPKNLAPVLFVGRSAFPNKELFFKGCSLPQQSMQKAQNMLVTEERPDLLWWEEELEHIKNNNEPNQIAEQKIEERLGQSAGQNATPKVEQSAGYNATQKKSQQVPRPLWPGKAARLPAFGAEESSLFWRNLCLHEAALSAYEMFAVEQALDIVGDVKWQNLLPPYSQLLPPVDYYARLPQFYTKARYSLTMTSLQLSCGLNQRHFDVWMAEGFLLTDATKGLLLFPKDLTEHITFATAKEIKNCIQFFENNPRLREKLTKHWKDYLLAQHTYTHRASYILEKTRP